MLYLFAAQTQVVGFATTPGGLAAQPEPVLTLAAAQGWWWIPAVLDLGLIMSFFACALADVGNRGSYRQGDFFAALTNAKC